MLSGIGPADHLREHGIPVISDNSGVGQNLQDHQTAVLSVRERGRTSYALNRGSVMPLAIGALQYALTRQGPFTSNIVEAGGFVRSRPDLDRPDLQFVFMTSLKDMRLTFPRAHGFNLFSMVLRPKSRGFVALRSADPTERPVLHPNFLHEEDDLRGLVHGLKLARRIVRAPAFAETAGDELSPGADVESDADLAEYIRRNVISGYHPVGTCKMGPDSDPLAVLDSRLKVRGVEGLRVADASIMPALIGGNTNAPTMMIAERCADFIKAAA
jgi:choline dehydrogenase-like flavoprotein